MQPGKNFSVAYAAAADRLFAAIAEACRGEGEWPARVGAAIAAVLELFAEEPQLGRLLVYEAYAEGRDAQLVHEETLARIVELLRLGRDDSHAPLLPDALEEGIVGGATFLVGRSLRAGEAERLPAMAPELTALVLTPYLGRQQAEDSAGLINP